MERKLRYSRQRERIYQYLLENHTHPSAETIYKDLHEEMPGLSLGTVYRNLNLLEELGKVRRVTSFQGVERYDACCGDHAHFLCTACGHLQDVEHAALDAIWEVLPPVEQFHPRHLSLTLTGLCSDCMERAPGTRG